MSNSALPPDLPDLYDLEHAQLCVCADILEYTKILGELEKFGEAKYVQNYLDCAKFWQHFPKELNTIICEYISKKI
jgi:hypothetical protein